MEQKTVRKWWFLFIMWIVAASVAVAIPLMMGLDIGTFFLLLALSLFASVFSFPLLFFTIFNWRKLSLLYRCIGLLPTLYFVAPLALHGG